MTAARRLSRANRGTSSTHPKNTASVPSTQKRISGRFTTSRNEVVLTLKNRLAGSRHLKTTLLKSLAPAGLTILLRLR